MDFNDDSESSDNFMKNNPRSADFISSASEKTTAIGFNGFSDSNDRISDYNSDGSFHSIETDEDDDSSIKTVNGDSNESAGDSNKNAKAIKSNVICSEENIENFLTDNAELVFSSGELKSRENLGFKFEKRNVSIRKTSTEDDTAADGFFDEHSKDSSANTEHQGVENSIRREHEKSHSNDDAIETNSPQDTRMTDRTSNADDESFSLDEILEESECSDKDQIQVSCTNDEHLAFDEESMASIEDNSESLILENDDESAGGKDQCHSPINESADSHEAEDYAICQEVQTSVTVEHDDFEENVENSSEEGVKSTSEESIDHISEEVVSTCQEIENNSEDTEDFLPVSVPCPDISTNNEAQKGEVSPEKSQNDGNSPSKENSLDATAEEAETICDSVVTNDITLKISPKSKQPENSPNHHLHSSVDPLDDQNAAEDSISHENSTEVPNDSVPSSHGESAPVEKSTDTLSVVSDLPHEKEAFRENDQTADPSTNPQEQSFAEELASDSTQELLRNLRRRVSSRRRNNSEGSELSLSDPSARRESDSSTLTAETPNKTNNLRTRSTLTSRSSRSRSNWQPKINDVMSASDNFFIRLEKFSDIAAADPDIKEEVIDESYEMNSATKKRFNLVDFSIKLEKIEVDSDVEVLSPPPSPPNAGSRSRGRPETLRNRRRSGTATSRSGPSTTSSARRAAANQRDGRVATRGAAKGESRANGRMAKSGARPAANRRLSAKPASKVATRRNIRSLRSTAAEDGDRERIHFLSMFNLRSRDDEPVKSILVKPRVGKARSKTVSFRLPAAEVASTRRKTAARARNAPKAVDEEARPQLTVEVPPLRYFKGDSSRAARSRPTGRKRNAATQEKVSLPTKRGRSSKAVEAKNSESEDEAIDENALEKLEESVDAARKTVDVWFECQCCNQKYYELENTKRHVRTHFPNCLTN